MFFSRLEDRYLVDWGDPSEAPGGLVGRTVSVGGFTLLDLSPARDLRPFALPVHVVFRIRYDGDSMQMQPIRSAGLRSYLEGHPGALQVVDVEHDLLITADTPEFLTFLGGHQRDTDLFYQRGGWMVRRTGRGSVAPDP